MRHLSSLPLPGIIIKSLQKAGYQYVDHIFDDKREVKCKALKILKNFGLDSCDLKDVLTPSPSFSAAQLLRIEALIERIPTFCKDLDYILGGGVGLGSVLQVCGPSGSGKTQFVLQLCVNVQIPPVFEGLDGEAVFIDTESSFTVARLKEIAEGAWKHCIRLGEIYDVLEELQGFNVMSILEKVHYITVTSYIHVLAAIHSVKYLVSTNINVKLIVIDSIVFPLLGISETLERTRVACFLISQLQELAKKYNLAVVVINDLTTRIEGKAKHLCPALGESLSHYISQTLMLGKIGSCFSAATSKSSSLPQNIVNFCILKDGIRSIHYERS